MFTKKQALREFRDNWNLACCVHPELKNDHIAKCESWNNYTDILCKSGMITLKQYETWTNPF